MPPRFPFRRSTLGLEGVARWPAATMGLLASLLIVGCTRPAPSSACGECKSDEFCCISTCLPFGSTCPPPDGGQGTSSPDAGLDPSPDAGLDGGPDAGPECIALAFINDNPNPTPGRCQGNAAITCQSRTFKPSDSALVSETCAPGYECREYDLDVSNNGGAVFTQIRWAGCVQVGSQPCAVDSITGAPADPYRCQGQQQIKCLMLPAPGAFWTPQLDFFSATTPQGYLSVVSCPGTEVCAGDYVVGDLVCIPRGTPACDGSEGDRGRCAADGSGIVRCDGAWLSAPGHQELLPCPAGQVCYPDSNGPYCDSPGEVPCDPATFGPSRCDASGMIIEQCRRPFTHHVDCRTYSNGILSFVGRCAMGDYFTPKYANGTCVRDQAAMCIPQDQPIDCDPARDFDQCLGDVMRHCDGTRWRGFDCSVSGMICDLASGMAGCRQANAVACDPAAAVFSSSCAGTTVVGCCACGDLAFNQGPPLLPGCVPGYEVRHDCAADGATCQLLGPGDAACARP